MYLACSEVLLRNESVRSLRARSERSERSGLKDLEERQRKVSGTRHNTRNQHVSHTASVRDTATPPKPMHSSRFFSPSNPHSRFRALSAQTLCLQSYNYITEATYNPSSSAPLRVFPTPLLMIRPGFCRYSSCSCMVWAPVRSVSPRGIGGAWAGRVWARASLEEAPAVLESVRLRVVVGGTEEYAAELWAASASGLANEGSE